MTFFRITCAFIVFARVHVAALEGEMRRLAGRDGEPVYSVDWGEAPELESLARRAQFVGNSLYPQIVALLGSAVEDAPRSFKVVFLKSLKGRPAQTRLNTIEINASYFLPNAAKGPAGFKHDLAEFDGTLAHEMAHIAGNYWHPWLLFRTRAPRHWIEGMADYARFKLGYTNQWRCAECSERYPHFKSGYSCAGAFLLFVDQRYGASAIRELNTALRQVWYSDSAFEKATGQPLGALWAEFTNTPAFRPIATKAHEYQQALGYRLGKPPWNVESRFRALVKSKPGGRTTLAALDFTDRLRLRGELPGIAAGEPVHVDHGERGVMPFARPAKENPDGYPATRWIFLHRIADRDSTYQYIVKKLSAHEEWRLTDAWRTDRNDVVKERFQINKVLSR